MATLTCATGCQLIFPLQAPDDASGTGDDEVGPGGDGSLPVIDARAIDASLLDAAPNCWSPQGGDEDEDTLVDGCDPCPADAIHGGDTDGDGVGDACDPHPTDTNRPDRIVYFEGFHSPLVAGWTTIGGNWEVQGGAFVQTKASDFALAVHAVPFDNATVRVKLDNFTIPTLGTSAAGAFLDVDPTTMTANPPGLLCGYTQAASENPFVRLARVGATTSTARAPVAPSGVLTVRLGPEGSGAACVFDRGTTGSRLTLSSAPRMGVVALQTASSIATFHSVMITTQAP